MTRHVVLLVVLSACEKVHETRADAGLSPTWREDTERAMQILEELATLATRHEDDCDAMARVLGDRIQRDLAFLERDRADDTERERELARAYLGGRIQRANNRMLPHFQRCREAWEVFDRTWPGNRP